MNKDQLQDMVSSIVKGKKKRRKELANLPFEEKIQILLRLQEIADEIARVKSPDKKGKRFKRWKI